MENYNSYSNNEYKSGLYFLFNKKHKCIYVGAVFNGATSSLYNRIVGNGNRAHNKDKWYNDVAYGCQYKFNQQDEIIRVIERLAIYGMKQPDYNDIYTDDETITKLTNLFKK